MKRKSILYKDLEVSRAKEIYDESCKNILANKIILAWIMKSCMKEYKDCSICDIADHYIEGTPEISQREVHRDEAPASDPGKIRGENTEDKAVNEGIVTRFIREDNPDIIGIGGEVSYSNFIDSDMLMDISDYKKIFIRDIP